MRQTFLQKNSMMHLLIEWIKGDWLFSSTRKLKIVPNKWSTVILWFCGFQLGQTFRSTQENELCKDFFLVCSMSTYNPIIHIRPILTRLGDFFFTLALYWRNLLFSPDCSRTEHCLSQHTQTDCSYLQSLKCNVTSWVIVFSTISSQLWTKPNVTWGYCWKVLTVSAVAF